MEKVIVLGSTGVADLVGIQATLLNKFVEREQYGIEASIRAAGGGRGKERLFSEADVYGIALVHWLFESGLRSEVIKRVLKRLCGGKKPNANEAAETVRNRKDEVLVVARQPRSKGNTKYPQQETEMCDMQQAALVGRKIDASLRTIVETKKLLAILSKQLGGK